MDAETIKRLQALSLREIKELRKVFRKKRSYIGFRIEIKGLDKIIEEKQSDYAKHVKKVQEKHHYFCKVNGVEPGKVKINFKDIK